MCFRSAQRVLKTCVCVCIYTMSPFPDAIPEVMAQVSSSLFPTHVRSKLVVFFF